MTIELSEITLDPKNLKDRGIDLYHRRREPRATIWDSISLSLSHGRGGTCRTSMLCFFSSVVLPLRATNQRSAESLRFEVLFSPDQISLFLSVLYSSWFFRSPCRYNCPFWFDCLALPFLLINCLFSWLSNLFILILWLKKVWWVHSLKKLVCAPLVCKLSEWSLNWVCWEMGVLLRIYD